MPAIEPLAPDNSLPHRDLPRRLLAAIETRIRLNTQKGGGAKARARLQEANEILGIMRNVIREYERTD